MEPRPRHCRQYRHRRFILSTANTLPAADPAAESRADTHAMLAGVSFSVIGLSTFLVMPQFVEAVATGLKYNEQQVGLLSSAVMVGATLAAVVSTLWIRRGAWRLIALAALVGMLAANGASMLVREFLPFIVLQAIGGFCCGSLYSLGLTVLSDSRHPHRYFAYAIGAQTVFQVLGLLAGPFLIHPGDANGLLGLFLALGVISLLTVRFVPLHGRLEGVAASGADLLSRPTLFALAGCLLFYVNVGAYWTYLERIGEAAGISLSAMSNGLGFAAAASIVGVFLATWLGVRRGLLIPVAASAFGVVASILMLVGELHLPAYVLSALIYGIAWNVSMTYQYSIVNVVDHSRRAVAFAPAFHNAGGVIGPALAALVVTETDHRGVLWLANVSVLLSLLCFAVSLRLSRRASAA
jgi:predicted MFS family arabinose efflux permease